MQNIQIFCGGTAMSVVACFWVVAVLLVENEVLFLVPTIKVLEDVFPKCF